MPDQCTSVTHFRLVFDRLKDFPQSEIHIGIPLIQKTLQAIKSLTDLARQLVHWSGKSSGLALLTVGNGGKGTRPMAFRRAL